MNIYIYKKKIDLLHLTNFKILTPLMGYEINNCFFFKFIIYVRGDHLQNSAQALENIAMPLVALPVWKSVSVLPTL
jgi:hypothetical protein